MTPLVILGIDAGDPEMIIKLVNEGHLPNLASIMQRGWYARTGGPELLLEHASWLGVVGDRPRGEHGYHFFRQLRPKSYSLQRVTASDFAVAPFWQNFAGSELKLAVIDVPDTTPIKGLAGVQLANWAVHDPILPPTSEPPELLGQVRQLCGAPIEIHETQSSSLQQDHATYLKLINRIAVKGKLCRNLLSRDQFDMAAMVFGESHTAAHQFWDYRNIESPADEKEKDLANAIKNIYIAIDREWGLIIDQIGEANLFAVSSVGMQSQYPNDGLIEDFLHELGYQRSSASAETGSESQTAVAPASKGFSVNLPALLRSLIPQEVRIAISRYFPNSVREKLLSNQFSTSSDWSKTTAFSVPGVFSSFIYVNLKDRQPSGTIEAGAEYEQVLNRLEGDLNQLIDPLTGQSPIEKIVRSAEMFEANRPPSILPDLIVLWKETNSFRTELIHPKARLTQKRPDWIRSSDHSCSGFVAAAGPAIAQRGDIGEIDVRDLVPQFQSILERKLSDRKYASSTPK